MSDISGFSAFTLLLTRLLEERARSATEARDRQCAENECKGLTAEVRRLRKEIKRLRAINRARQP